MQITGTSIAQKMLRLALITRYNPEDHGSVRAIEILRDSRRALAEQKVMCPELFFVAIFLATLEPNSAIKDRLQIMVNDAGTDIKLDVVITAFETWLRDQEIQKVNDSAVTTFKSVTGKSPRNPKALLLLLSTGPPEQSLVLGVIQSRY